MKKPSPLVQILFYVVLVVAVIFAVYPVWFTVLASVRPGQQLYTLNLAGMFVPTEITLENFRTMLFVKDFPIWLKNSLFVAGLTTIACVALSTSGAFAFSRFDFVGREAGLILFLAIQAFPGVLALVPIALILYRLGLYGSHWGLIVAYSTGTLVFCTWNLKGYFDTIPIDLEESGMIDGCGPIQSFLRIALPLSRPALATTALFGFLAGWNEYVMASVLLAGKQKLYTLPISLASLANDTQPLWGEYAAGALLVSIPVMILFLWLQKYLESGLTLGGVKG
ncbi:MAG TPA: sugar ABC transporter permease [Chloroflexi bacterium]|nr:sugar ABC transporter permease [Chloroflexota bacterium]